MKLTVTLGTRTFIRVLPRLLFRQNALENSPVKRLQRLRDRIQDGEANLLNPLEPSAAVVFGKLVPGFVAVRKLQVIVEQIHNGLIVFQFIRLNFTPHNTVKFGFHFRNFLISLMLHATKGSLVPCARYDYRRFRGTIPVPLDFHLAVPVLAGVVHPLQLVVRKRELLLVAAIRAGPALDVLDQIRGVPIGQDRRRRLGGDRQVGWSSSQQYPSRKAGRRSHDRDCWSRRFWIQTANWDMSIIRRWNPDFSLTY